MAFYFVNSLSSSTRKYNNLTILIFVPTFIFIFFKGMLRPIFCIDINTHIDRKLKNYIKFTERTNLSECFCVY